MKLPTQTDRYDRYMEQQRSGIIERELLRVDTAIGQQPPYHARTAAEIVAGVTPTNYAYPPGHVMRYGAVGDGVTDDSAKVQAAITAALAGGYVLEFEPWMHCYIASHLSVTGDLTIEGNGATIRPAATTNGILVDAGTAATTTLSVDAQIHAEAITVASAASMSAGQIVTLTSTASWYVNPNSESLYKGEISRIKSISSNVLSLEDALFDNYDISEETVTVAALNPSRFICRDLSIIYSAPTAAVGIQVTAGADAILENVTVDGAQTQGVNISRSYNVTIKNCNIYRSNNAGLGYGVQVNASVKADVKDSLFIGNRRGVDFSGSFPSRLCSVDSCSVDASGNDSAGTALTSNSGNSGLGDHETSEFNRYVGNQIRNCRIGILIRGKDAVVEGNHFAGDIRLACVLVNRGYSTTVKNNVYSSGLRPARTLDVVAADDNEQKAPWFIQIVQPVNLTGGFFEISNNTANDLKNAFVSFNFTSAAQTLSNFYCHNNSVRLQGSDAQATVYFLETTSGGQSLTLNDSIILDNRVTRGEKPLVMYPSSVVIDYAQTCDVDNYLLPASVLTETTGAAEANITKTQVLLNLSVRDGHVSIVGAVQFNILNATSVVKLQNLPSKSLNAGTFGPAYAWPFVASVTTAGVGAAGMVAMPAGVTGSIPTSAWLSYNQTAYNTGWPVGSGYIVPVSINYKTVRRFE